MRRLLPLLLVLIGCGDASDMMDDGIAGTVAVVDRVSLPYVVAGQTVPPGALAIRAPDDHGSMDALVLAPPSGPFAVIGSTAPLAAGEQRELSVVYTGDVNIPALASGAVTLTVDNETFHVTLAAVIGEPELVPAVWTTDGWGSRTVVALPSAPFPADGDGPWYDPSVLLFVPRGHSEVGPIHVVTHLHGHGTVLLETVARQRIVEQAAISGRNLLLIIPQGPVEAASGDFGQLVETDGYRRMVRDAVSVLYRDGFVHSVAAGKQTVTAHSGGYEAAAAVLEAGGLPIDNVHLFDALFANVSDFENHVLGGGLLRSVYTLSGGTIGNNAALLAALESKGVAVSVSLSDMALSTSDVSIAYTPSGHNDVVSDRRSYARWLATSGLPPHDLAPPELLAVKRDGDELEAQWRLDRGLPDRRIIVQGSEDGRTWLDLGSGDNGKARVPAASWVRLVARTGGTRSDPSDVYAGSGTTWLVVDGFDRIFGGSYAVPTHSFAARVGNALPGGASTASNEALIEGRVDPLEYDRVVWLLGDESRADDTFDADEQAILRAIVDAGVPVVVSGAEVGYATDAGFLSSTLDVRYVADDADTTHAGGYTFGVIYPEDYPDVLDGDATLWFYDTGGAAAVITRAGIIVGFPLETLADEDLGPALAEIDAALVR